MAVEIASLPRPLRRIHRCDRLLQHGISGHQKCFEDLVGQRSSSGPFLLPKTSRENEMNPSICSGTPPFQDGVSKPFPLSYAAHQKKKNSFCLIHSSLFTTSSTQTRQAEKKKVAILIQMGAFRRENQPLAVIRRARNWMRIFILSTPTRGWDQ